MPRAGVIGSIPQLGITTNPLDSEISYAFLPVTEFTKLETNLSSVVTEDWLSLL